MYSEGTDFQYNQLKNNLPVLYQSFSSDQPKLRDLIELVAKSTNPPVSHTLGLK
jgi:hypothetical protein